MEQNQLENNQRLAIGSPEVSTPEFIEKIEREAEGYKMVYYLWLSRLFIATTIASLLFLISASLALFKLAPMVSVEPFLVINQDSSDNIVREEPISLDMASKDKLMETFIRQYVILRNTVINDPLEMRSRWQRGGMVHFYSSPEVFNPFETWVVGAWENIFMQALVREVEIISVSRQGGKKSPIWKVDYKTYDLYDAQGKTQVPCTQK